MHFHYNGYISRDPRIQDAAGYGIDRATELPETMDVLIVGSGPAGMIAAAQLSQFPEINTRIIERRNGRLELGQADGIQPRTIEVLQVRLASSTARTDASSQRPGRAMASQSVSCARGTRCISRYVSPPLFAHPIPTLLQAFYNPSANGGIERTHRAPDVTAPTARFPFEVTLHQGAIEAIFLDSMRASGLEVDRPIVPTAIGLPRRSSTFERSSSFFSSRVSGLRRSWFWMNSSSMRR